MGEKNPYWTLLLLEKRLQVNIFVLSYFIACQWIPKQNIVWKKFPISWALLLKYWS